MIVTDQKKLRQVSVATTSQEVKELRLVSKLREANKTAWTEGCGLASIQIGVPLRFAWYKINGREGVLLNPMILRTWGSSNLREGCLSIPQSYVKVDRPHTIEYLTNGKKNKANGFLARLICHEIDHMDGILNIDKVVE